MIMRMAAAAAAASLLALAAGTALAQSALQDQIVQNGRLQTSDPQVDGAFYDCYAIDAQAGDAWTITLQSEDFDSYLAIGSGSSCGRSMSVFGTNDDGDGIGLNSRLSYSFDYSGRYLVRVTSLGDGDTGRYTILGVRSRGGGSTALPTRVLLRGTEYGNLEAGDRAEAGGGAYFDCFTFGALNGQAVTITHSSTDFDSYLKLFAGVSCDGAELARDDDGAGSLNSRIQYTFDEDGIYSVRASSLTRDTGAYTLEVELR